MFETAVTNLAGRVHSTRAAAGTSDRRRPQLTTPTMPRGFLFCYGAGLGPQLGL